MPDSSKFPAPTPGREAPSPASSRVPAPDAPEPATFASPINLTSRIFVSGPAWAEYHLLLADSPRAFARIEREVRIAGGAPAIALLLARWRAECQGAHCAPVELSLPLANDPNARLVRRALEGWASRMPALRLDLAEDEGAPAVPYRILLWPCDSASAQVLQCGEMEARPIVVEVEPGLQVLEAAADESLGAEVAAAARAWAMLLGHGAESAERLAGSARRKWLGEAVGARVEYEVAWSEVEAEA